jgi:hypothetical protein
MIFIFFINLSMGSKDQIIYINESNTTGYMPIWVGVPRVIPEESSQYWWLSYNFSVIMKSQEQGGTKIGVALFTDTDKHHWRAVANKEVLLTQNPTLIFFDVKPFDILDANGMYNYKFVYTENDQAGKNFTQMQGPRPLNPKLLMFTMTQGAINYILIIFTTLFISISIERRFFR